SPQSALNLLEDCRSLFWYLLWISVFIQWKNCTFPEGITPFYTLSSTDHLSDRDIGLGALCKHLEYRNPTGSWVVPRPPRHYYASYAPSTPSPRSAFIVK